MNAQRRAAAIMRGGEGGAMGETTHTPGPWAARQRYDGRWWIEAQGEKWGPLVEGATEADARLVAAAPDGYDLGKHILAMAGEDPYLDGHPEWAAIVDEARAFITKAEGREP